MTHLYTLLVGGLVLPGEGRPACTALCWAEDTVLALGDDEEVLGISRGDSAVVELEGRVVLPLTDGGDLEIGGRADLAILAPGGRRGHGRVDALVEGGRLVVGGLPGLEDHAGRAGHRHAGAARAARRDR